MPSIRACQTVSNSGKKALCPYASRYYFFLPLVYLYAVEKVQLFSKYDPVPRRDPRGFPSCAAFLSCSREPLKNKRCQELCRALVTEYGTEELYTLPSKEAYSKDNTICDSSLRGLELAACLEKRLGPKTPAQCSFTIPCISFGSEKKMGQLKIVRLEPAKEAVEPQRFQGESKPIEIGKITFASHPKFAVVKDAPLSAPQKATVGYWPAKETALLTTPERHFQPKLPEQTTIQKFRVKEPPEGTGGIVSGNTPYSETEIPATGFETSSKEPEVYPKSEDASKKATPDFENPEVKSASGVAKEETPIPYIPIPPPMPTFKQPSPLTILTRKNAGRPDLPISDSEISKLPAIGQPRMSKPEAKISKLPDVGKETLPYVKDKYGSEDRRVLVAPKRSAKTWLVPALAAGGGLAGSLAGSLLTSKLSKTSGATEPSDRSKNLPPQVPVFPTELSTVPTAYPFQTNALSFETEQKSSTLRNISLVGIALAIALLVAALLFKNRKTPPRSLTFEEYEEWQDDDDEHPLLLERSQKRTEELTRRGYEEPIRVGSTYDAGWYHSSEEDLDRARTAEPENDVLPEDDTRFELGEQRTTVVTIRKNNNTA